MTRMDQMCTAMEQQRIRLAGVANARELGGYQTMDGGIVKRGVLLRSAALPGDTTALLEDMRRCRIAHVIDFRSSYEKRMSPEPVLPGICQHELDVMRNDLAADWVSRSGPAQDWLSLVRLGIEAGVISPMMYVNFLKSESGMESYRTMFRILLENRDGEAVLFHCANGKDRTGVAAMLILSALQVDEPTILRDFMLSNGFFAREIAGMRKLLEEKEPDPQIRESLLIGCRMVSETYMNHAVDALTETYGSPLGYIRQALGVTEEELITLRRRYVSVHADSC